MRLTNKFLSEADKTSIVQTLLFPKTKFTKSQAVAWAKNNGFKYSKVDETDDFYRLRQIDPDKFQDGAMSGSKFKTITLKNSGGVEAVVGKLAEAIKKVKAEINISLIQLTESIQEGSKYKAVIIKAGQTESANASTMINGIEVPIYKNYTENALKEAVEKGLFENIPALWRTVDQHLTGANTGVNQIVGTFTEVKWNDQLKQVEGIFNLKQGTGIVDSFKSWLIEAWKKTKQIGLSISGIGKYIIEVAADKYIAIVTEIESLQSIDPVPAGNAGGKLIHIIESYNLNNKKFLNLKEGNNMNPELKLLIFALLNGALMISEGSTVDSIDDDSLLNGLYQYCLTLQYSSDLVSEAIKDQLTKIDKLLVTEGKIKQPILQDIINKKPPVTAPATVIVAEADKPKNETADLLNKAELLLCKTILRDKLSESKLPKVLKDKIAKQFENKIFKEKELEDTLVLEQKVLAELNPAFINNGGADNIQLGQSSVDKIQKQLEYMFLSPFSKAKLTEADKKDYKDHGVDITLYSIKELYRTLTGDINVSGERIHGKGLLSEALVTANLASIFKNALNKSLMMEYNFSAYNLDWRKLVSSIVPRQDFKTNTVVKMGGYANLPIVAENGPYTAAVSPGDDEITYAIRKRGYTETLTREMILNDDLGAIRKIPIRMGQAAARTLYEFVFDLIIANPNMDYDGVALFNAAHNNILVNALGDTSYMAARNLMKNQLEADSLKKIGITPKFLLVAAGTANEKIAYDLTTEAYKMQNPVPEFHQTWRVEPVSIAHTADANDWFLLADPNLYPTIEIGFLQGREDPEIFVADMPTQGAYFTNDQILYKIRHEYDGDLLDHRSFVGAIVP